MRTANTHQTGRMQRLIRVFAGRTGHLVIFVVLLFKYSVLSQSHRAHHVKTIENRYFLYVKG